MSKAFKFPKTVPVLRIITGIISALIVFGLIHAAINDPPAIPELKSWSKGKPDWYRGLAGMKNMHLSEYRKEKIFWELWAPRTNVRLQKFVYGFQRTRPLLHMIRPRAVIHQKDWTMEIMANRAYFDPWKKEWVFMQGQLRTKKTRKSFRQLFWLPDKNELQWPKKKPLHPIFRFWEPNY